MSHARRLAVAFSLSGSTGSGLAFCLPTGVQGQALPFAFRHRMTLERKLYLCHVPIFHGWQVKSVLVALPA